MAVRRVRDLKAPIDTPLPEIPASSRPWSEYFTEHVVRTKTLENATQIYETTTTNNTITTLATLECPASTTFVIQGVVVARRTGGSAGSAEDGAGYEIFAVCKNTAGTAALIGSTVSPAHESNSNLAVAFSVTGSTVLLRVTGDTNNDYSWRAVFRTVSVSSV